MDYRQMNRDLREVKTVPWQLAAVILGLFFGLPGSLIGTWALVEAKGQGSSTLAAIIAVPSYLMLLWGVLGMRSRLKQAVANGEPAPPIRNKMLGGGATVVGCVVLLSLLSYVANVPAVAVGAMGF